MSLSKQLFRESALERLSSPEQLDQMLQVTSPKGWVSLIAVWTILAAVVTWSVVGSVPTTEEGRGMLVPSDDLKQVESPGAGRLHDISVAAGDYVTVGQVIAQIDKQDIIDQIKDSEQRLNGLKDQKDRLDKFDRTEESKQAELAVVENDRLDRTIEFAVNRVQRLTELRDKVEAQVRGGGMIPLDVDHVVENLETTQMTIEQARLQKEQLSAKSTADSFQRQREALNRTLKIQELEVNIGILHERLERERDVHCLDAGKVVEVRAAENSVVTVGYPILLVAPIGTTSQPLKAILYVSAQTGMRIEEGMDVQLVPSTVKREEYGSLKGKVRRKGQTTTSKARMLISLRDPDLVEKFSQEIGFPLEVDVDLIPDSSTKSGFKWTSGQGPQTKISAGTHCSGSVTVKSQRPFTLVIPMLKRLEGGGGGAD